MEHRQTASFTVTPEPGYAIKSVTGCSGALSGSTYTTAPMLRACAVRAVFRRLAALDPLVSR